MHSNATTIEIAQPKLFTMGAVLTVSAYGLLLAAPIFLSLLVVSVIKLGITTVLIPLLVVAATAYFLPFGLGNTYVTRLVQSLHPAASKGGDGFIVQLTLSPRLRSGLRAILEDADDIGYLSFSETELLFQGDSVKLSVPFDRIAQVCPENIGLRGLFVYGRRIKVVVSGLPEVESFEFAERSSWVLPTSRATTRKLYERLSNGAIPRSPPPARPPAGPPCQT
jgi:hypothetical protein